MKKIGLIVAALSVISVVLPSIASAETIIVKHGHPRHYHKHEVIIIKHRH
jgi:hypothetical protein